MDANAEMLAGFMPHGMCYMWRPSILWTHVLSDALVGLSYFSIPAVLALFAARRPDLVYRPIVWLFTAFIILCGLTHFFSIYTVWVPIYPAEGVVKAATAIVSVATAIVLWPLLPRALALPSTAELEARNQALTREVALRTSAEARLEALAYSLERRVEDRTSELQRANRALQDFAATASHDLQSPLRQIGLLAQLIKRDAGPEFSEAAAARLEQIGDSVDRMQSLIASLLEYARLVDTLPTVESVDLTALAQHAVNELDVEIEEAGATVEVGDLPGIEGDPVLLRQVFANLIENAIKHRGEAAPVIRVGGAVVGDHARIAVSDNGPGIAPDYAEMIFKMLQRVSVERPGAGVGLAFCKQIVEAHRGRIWLDRDHEGGARFVMDLPLSQARTGRDSQS